MSLLGLGLDFVGGLLGSSSYKKAATNAANAQADAMRYAADTQRQATADALAAQQKYYDQAFNVMKGQEGKFQGLFGPYIQAGQQALPQLQAAASQESPLYRQQQEDLTKAMNAQLAQRGMFNSGRGLTMLGDQQRRLGMEEANARYGRLADLVNLGRGATNTYSSLDQANVGNLTNMMTGMGSQQANLLSGLGSDLAGLGVAGGINQAGLSSALGQTQGSNINNMTGLLKGLFSTLNQNKKSSTSAGGGALSGLWGGLQNMAPTQGNISGLFGQIGKMF